MILFSTLKGSLQYNSKLLSPILINLLPPQHDSDPRLGQQVSKKEPSLLFYSPCRISLPLFL